jgi:acyl-coenzyme A synthetase/AMP-(fatty) acid ligase
MYGYWDSATASPQSAGKIKAGGLKTGDAGFLNTEGFLTLKGRLDDVVLLSEGFTVYPKELENVLSTVPGIIELAVVSANDPAGNGQVPIVFFRTKYDLADSITELRTRIKETLSPIKHPKYLVFTQQTFSRGTNGKVIKQKLIDKLDEVQLIPFSPPLL